MKFWRQVLLGLPVVALVCGVGPAPAEAQFSQQGPKLVATDAIGDARQGASVALSSDGNSAIVSVDMVITISLEPHGHIRAPVGSGVSRRNSSRRTP
jgi:hypothetical protein